MTGSRIRALAGVVVAVVAVLCAASAAPAAAAPGALDPSFGSGGFATTAYGTWAAAAADVVQPDGFVVTAGQTNVNGTDEIIATRYTPSGHADNRFGRGGIVTVDIGGSAGVDSGAGIALQRDGKILIAGTGAAGGQSDFAVVRLNADGSLDATFGRNGAVTIPIGQGAYATAVLVDPYGRVDVAGTAAVSGINHFAVARLTPDGALDHSFGALGVLGLGGVTVLPPYAAGWGMVLQSDGSLVLAGQQLYNSTQVFIAARVLPNGLPDASFGTGGIVTIPIGSWAVGYAVSLQSDGKIVVGGNGNDTRGKAIGAVLRLNPNGSLDPTFASGGILQFPGGGINLTTIDSAGHIYLVGIGETLIRLNSNGTGDTTFGQRGFGLYCNGINCAANGASIDPATGNLVLAGIATINGRPQVLATRHLVRIDGGTTAGGTGGRGILRKLTVATHQHGFAVKVKYVLAGWAALMRAKLFVLGATHGPVLVRTSTRHDVRKLSGTLVLKLPPAYRNAIRSGRRVKLRLELNVVTASGARHTFTRRVTLTR